MADIFAFAETRLGETRRCAFEAVTAARRVADQSGGQVHAMLAGGPGIGQHAAKLAAHGADVVIVLEHAGFANYNPEALCETIAARLRAHGYRAAFFAASSS